MLKVLIRKWGVNWGVWGVGKVTFGSSCCRFFDVALCGQGWVLDIKSVITLALQTFWGIT